MPGVGTDQVWWALGMQSRSLLRKSSLKLRTEIYWQRMGRAKWGVRMSEAERKACVKALRPRRI